MTVSEYKKICMQFAHDTKDWTNLDDRMIYKTSENNGRRFWSGTCDGGDEAGIYLDWAFHKSKEYIEDHVYDEFVKALLESIECDAMNCEDKYDSDLIYSTIALYSEDRQKRYVDVGEDTLY